MPVGLFLPGPGPWNARNPERGVSSAPSAYAAMVVTHAALYYWRLDDAGATAVDQGLIGALGGTPAHGTLVNTPTLGVSGAVTAEPPNLAMSFASASSEYIDTTNLGTWGSSRATSSVGFWIKTTTAAQQFVMGVTNAGTAADFQVETNSNASGGAAAGKTAFIYNGNAADISANIYDGNWHQVVAVQAAAVWTVYVDGVSVATNQVGSNTTFANFDTNVAIGAWRWAAVGVFNYFDGSLDEVAVYGTALTAQQVEDQYVAAGGVLSEVPEIPLETAAGVSNATLALSAPTGVTLATSPAQSAATLALSAPTRVVLETAAAQSAATLALTAPARVTLQTSAAQSAATLSLAAPTRVVLGTSAAQSAATLALSAPTQVPLQPSAAVASATCSVTIPSTAAEVPLSTAAGQSAATLALSAPTRVTLATGAATSSATLTLAAPTRVILGTSAAVASATLALSAQTQIPLQPSAAVSSATLAVAAGLADRAAADQRGNRHPDACPHRSHPVVLGTSAAQSAATLLPYGPDRVTLGNRCGERERDVCADLRHPGDPAGDRCGSELGHAGAARRDPGGVAERRRSFSRDPARLPSAAGHARLWRRRPRRRPSPYSFPGRPPLPTRRPAATWTSIRTGGDIITPDAIPLGCIRPPDLSVVLDLPGGQYPVRRAAARRYLRRGAHRWHPGHPPDRRDADQPSDQRCL